MRTFLFSFSVNIYCRAHDSIYAFPHSLSLSLSRFLLIPQTRIIPVLTDHAQLIHSVSINDTKSLTKANQKKKVSGVSHGSACAWMRSPKAPITDSNSWLSKRPPITESFSTSRHLVRLVKRDASKFWKGVSNLSPTTSLSSLSIHTHIHRCTYRCCVYRHVTT